MPNKRVPQSPFPIYEDLPSDASFDYHDEPLDHGRATANGTCLTGPGTDLEPLEDYKEGGFHPIHLGDTLGTSYCVLRKLGHGGYGTVWLCRDTRDDYARYVAVKVTIAMVKAEDISDLTILAGLDRSSAPGSDHIAFPLDTFSITGPNGTHQCIVLPLLGPCVSPELWVRLKDEPGPVLRKMAYQAVKAINFLHTNGICHGDFRPANILAKLNSLNHVSEEELLSRFGEPKLVKVVTESGDELPVSSPRYLTPAIDLSRLGDEYLTDQICVIDFGESFRISDPPDVSCIPEMYLSPEVLLQLLRDEKSGYGDDDIDDYNVYNDDNNGDNNEEDTRKNNKKDEDEDVDDNKDNPKGERAAIGPACDLWALGCTLFEIRQQTALFHMIHDPDDLVAEMVRYFGKLPTQWWDTWERRAEYFDEHGTWIRENEDRSLEWLLDQSSDTVQSPTFQQDSSCIRWTSMATPQAEQKLMADLLYKLFQYDPDKRISAEGAVTHEWFKM
ncbi:CMGC/SRPK protein kinase [Sporothrix schenckii ATCC 58251]|uniref:CMGC/SRPK protein kinase n=1 Tax=Sporothrix schenckii (strain ATCC 58251 / de Perez 2211183) TaxID=1391915 RepID=U7PXP4_SPOS1|nr:CMGC/SRPK protein kinase [Sporothrix schenckii ATCC 58251]